MSIGSITDKPFAAIDHLAKAQEMLEGKEADNSSFASYLQKSWNDVNTLVGDADKASQNVAIGKTENIHEAMITMEKAETAFKFMMQVRNKAMEAYHDVMRMQL